MKKIDPLELLNKIVVEQGSRRKAALYIGVSAMYLCDVLNGNREAGEKITGFLGITKHEHKEVWYTKP